MIPTDNLSLRHPSSGWNATGFFRRLCDTNKLAASNGFHFCRVSGLDGFEEALGSMQEHVAFCCVSDISDGYMEINNTPRTRRVKTVFLAMRHPVGDMDARLERMNTMRAVFTQFMSVLLLEKVKLEQNCIYLDPRVAFTEIDRYFFSGCACAYFQIAVDVFTDLRFVDDSWYEAGCYLNLASCSLEHLDEAASVLADALEMDFSDALQVAANIPCSVRRPDDYLLDEEEFAQFAVTTSVGPKFPLFGSETPRRQLYLNVATRYDYHRSPVLSNAQTLFLAEGFGAPLENLLFCVMRQRFSLRADSFSLDVKEMLEIFTRQAEAHIDSSPSWEDVFDVPATAPSEGFAVYMQIATKGDKITEDDRDAAIGALTGCLGLSDYEADLFVRAALDYEWECYSAKINLCDPEAMDFLLQFGRSAYVETFSAWPLGQPFPHELLCGYDTLHVMVYGDKASFPFAEVFGYDELQVEAARATDSKTLFLYEVASHRVFSQFDAIIDCGAEVYFCDKAVAEQDGYSVFQPPTTTMYANIDFSTGSGTSLQYIKAVKEAFAAQNLSLSAAKNVVNSVHVSIPFDDGNASALNGLVTTLRDGYGVQISIDNYNEYGVWSPS